MKVLLYGFMGLLTIETLILAYLLYLRFSM